MTHGLILHVQGPTLDSLAGSIRIAANARTELPDIPIEIVLQGALVAAATVNVMPQALLATAQGVRVEIKVCANSLRSQDIDVSDLAEGIGVVPAAVSHLAERQWQGWAYVRI